MKYSDLKEEKKLRKRKFKCVVGLDEAGRGPLAGPVVAAAVTVLPGSGNMRLAQKLRLRDSKKLSVKKREELAGILTNHPAIRWEISRVSEKTIDRINVLQATRLAMKKAVERLARKKPGIDFLILDGNMKIDSPVAQKSIVKADEKVFSCAAASIIAKTARDGIMARMHKKHPCYGFDRHKGYPTKLHLAMIQKHGPCRIHRKSFKPLKQFY